MNWLYSFFGMKGKRHWVKLPPDVAPPMVSLKEYNILLKFAFPLIVDHAMANMQHLMLNREAWSILMDIFDEPDMMDLDVPLIQMGSHSFRIRDDQSGQYWKRIILELAMRGYYLEGSYVKVHTL